MHVEALLLLLHLRSLLTRLPLASGLLRVVHHELLVEGVPLALSWAAILTTIHIVGTNLAI